jgi:hypothetical protein
MRKLLICIIIIIHTQLIFGQKPIEESNRFWFGFGVGAFGGEKAFGLSLMGMDFGYAVKNNLFSLKIDYNYDISNTNFYGDDFNNEQFGDIGILYGLVLTNHKAQCSVSAGIGIMGGVMNGKYSKDSNWVFAYDGYRTRNFTTINIPVETQFNILATSHFGLGCTIFANLNTKRILGGVLMKFRWGKLK